MKMLTFSSRTAKEIMRDPVNVGFGLGFPVVLILLLSAIQANVPVPVFEIDSLAPGMTVFGLSFMTLFAATLIAKDRESALLQRLYTTPLTAADFIFGYTLPLLPIALCQAAVCFVTAFFLGLEVTLRRCRAEKDRAGLAEAEKALQKYPNAFEIVYYSAALYRVFGLVEADAALLRRALELLERARLLLPQNTDPKISETVLYAETAQTLLSLGEADKAVRIWQAHNAGGFYSDQIGQTLASDCGRLDEAMPYLSDALLTVCASVIRIVMGYLNVDIKTKDYLSRSTRLSLSFFPISGKQGNQTGDCKQTETKEHGRTGR